MPNAYSDSLQGIGNGQPRIVVSVDMISTGTDIKPVEVLLFMRLVRSRVLFDQMVGRGTRVIDDNDLLARGGGDGTLDGRHGAATLVGGAGLPEAGCAAQQPAGRNRVPC